MEENNRGTMKVYIVKFIENKGYVGMEWDRVIVTNDPAKIRFFPDMDVLKFTMLRWRNGQYTVHELELP